MTKEIHAINTRALDFVVELIDYIAEYPDDGYMTMECLCRKLVKHGLIDKVDGRYEPKDEPQTNADQHIQSVESVESVGSNLEPFRVDEPQTERNE